MEELNSPQPQEETKPDWKELAKMKEPEQPEEKPSAVVSWLVRVAGYVLVAAVAAAVASAVTLFLSAPDAAAGYSKLEEMKALISQCYIGGVDANEIEDAAAAAMVAATGDQWSYYIPAEQMQMLYDQKENSYVGIGVTISVLANDQGFEITRLDPNGSAIEGGVQVGDIIVAVDGNRVEDIGSEKAQNMVSGEEGTYVSITVVRGDAEIELELIRKRIVQAVATGRMLEGDIGYIRIENFNKRASDETIALFEQMEKDGAKAMIFDVRFNPGGYKNEMVEILDYLLPEGILFRSEAFDGSKKDDYSDASCKQMPMAVLINGESYSAAEFFAAALKEYDYAVTVGQNTTGKGYFQSVFELSDGSAMNLSVGRYYTPNGVSLAEVGGLVPDVLVEVDEETMIKIYTQTLTDEEDLQLQAAIAALKDRK